MNKQEIIDFAKAKCKNYRCLNDRNYRCSTCLKKIKKMTQEQEKINKYFNK